MPQTEHRPRLSFLTTAYQTESYLAQTVDSVLAQTADDWELVVVDNGNSDEIAAIVTSYRRDPRIRLVRQGNKGYTGGVTAAAAAARGDFYCVLDSDDQLLPGYVARISSYLDAHPEVDAVGCDAEMFVDGEPGVLRHGYLHSIGTAPPDDDGDRLSVVDVLGGKVPYYTAAIRREAWDAVGGYQPGVDDVDESVLIWLRLATRFQVRLIPDRLARYRVREESLSRDPNKVERFESALIRTFERFAAESGNPTYVAAVQTPVRRLRYHQALRRARWAFLDRDMAAARRFARDAFAQRHTLRAAAVIGSLSVAPRLLTSVHPLKERVALLDRRMRRRRQP